MGIPRRASKPLFVQHLDQADNEVGARMFHTRALVFAGGVGLAESAPQDAMPYVNGKEGDEFHLPFWDRLNDKLDAARDRGIGMYYMFYADDFDKPDAMGITANSVEEDRLFRYAIARLAPYPTVLWDTGIDISEYRSEGWTNSFVDFFQANDPWQHPVSSRDVPGFIPSQETYRSQGGAGDGRADVPSRSQLVSQFDASTVPIAHNDHYRVGHPIGRGNWDNDAIRRVLWRMGLSGHQAVLIDYGRGDPDVAVIDEGAAYVGNATSFFNSYLQHGLGALEPQDQLLSSSTDGSIGSDVFLSANLAKEYVVYAKFGGSFDLDLTGAGQLNSRWYDPHTGRFSGESTVLGGGTVRFSAPSGSQDWVLHLYEPLDATPPSEPTSLVATPLSDSRIDLVWSPSIDLDSGIQRYNVYRDGNKIGESTTTAYSDTGLDEQTVYTYSVSAVNGSGLEGSQSIAQAAITFPDTTVPTIVSVEPKSVNVVELTFSEPVEQATAEDSNHYTLDQGASVMSATLSTNEVRVSLVTSPLVPQLLYTLNVTNVRDQATTANTIDPATEVSFIGLAPVTEGLLALYELEEGSGTTVSDSSGNGHDGTLTGGPLWNGTGQIGGALEFDGTDDSVAVADDPQLSNLDTMTVSAWINVNSINPADQSTIVGKWSSNSSRREFLLELETNGAISFAAQSGTPTSGSILAENTWYHVAATYDLNTVNIYLDGVLDVSGTSFRGSRDSDSDFSIGARIKGSTRDQFFDGTIDDVRLYDRVLTVTEIESLFVAGSVPDTTPPVITNVLTTNITEVSAQISWDTDEGADSQVEYGITTALGTFTPLDSALVSDHTVSVTGLSADTTYFYRMISVDASGNTATDDNGGLFYSFTTSAPDTTPPLITNVLTANITEGSAQVTWNTDEASDSQVEYGTTTALGTFTPLDTSLVTNHSVSLANLTFNTTYFYRVISADSAGNMVTADNGGLYYSFTTSDTTPPVITNVLITNITDVAAQITWNTDEASDSQVEYGTTTALGTLTPLDTSLVTNHSVSLANLTSNTTYFYRVISTDASGNTTSDDNGGLLYSFTTTNQLLGPIGQWTLDEGSGLNASDSSGNGHDGTLTGGPLWNGTGQIGGALEFDGTDDSVAVADDPQLSNLDTMTVSAWINVNSINPADQSTIVGKWSSNSSRREFLLELETNGAISFAAQSGTPTSGSILAENTWYHVAVTYDLNTVNIYLNGVLDVSGTSSRGSRDSDSDFSIGARIKGSTRDQFFDGTIDDVRLYDRVLSAAEIQQLFGDGSATVAAAFFSSALRAPLRTLDG